MTIIPQPLQKPLRRFEMVAGLICVAAGAWALIRFGSDLAGSGPGAGDRSGWAG